MTHDDRLDAEVAEWLARAGEIAAEATELPPPAAAETELLLDGRDVPSLRLRVYRPAGAGPHPVHVLAHGGGFAFGSIDDRVQIAAARERSAGAGCIVVDVDYRLAPEHPFPAAVDDVVAVVRWLRAGGLPDADAARIVAGGISAGSALVVGAALELRGSDPRALIGLVLEIPSLDLRPGGLWLERFAEFGSVAPRAEVRGWYLAGASPDDPRASPVAAPDLTGLPPTHVVVAELDPLRAGGEVFVRRLRTAGVTVTATRHLGAVHGSLEATAISRDARIWRAEVIAVLREMLAV